MFMLIVCYKTTISLFWPKTKGFGFCAREYTNYILKLCNALLVSVRCAG